MGEGQMHLLGLVHRRASHAFARWLTWKGASVAFASCQLVNYSYTKDREIRCLLDASHFSTHKLRSHLFVNFVMLHYHTLEVACGNS